MRRLHGGGETCSIFYPVTVTDFYMEIDLLLRTVLCVNVLKYLWSIENHGGYGEGHQRHTAYQTTRRRSQNLQSHLCSAHNKPSDDVFCRNQIAVCIARK